ncbi:hypothetical protein HYC85_017624 [Camellia sinensis]|uniref:Cytochrome b561 and DOMON domain-containing protein n=1 Tax=Camellia sinensis TaxID=4442 RepID=A0A7J7GSW6_CAMSI|nr:hypothetical protein HYC85_017624 [Camellia sinensis]
MTKIFRSLLFCSVLIPLFLLSSAQSCNNYAFASNKVFSACTDLPYLNAFLHLTYNPSSGTAQIAYRLAGITSSSWVAWAINPESRAMIGSQALVAFQKSDGSMSVYTSPLGSYKTTLQMGNLSFAVSDLSAYVFEQFGKTVQFPMTLLKCMISPSLVLMSGQWPLLNLLSGQSRTTEAGGAVNSKIKRRNIHGVLNAISWGILMPLGVMIARYLKVFESADPAWFYLHVTCQTSAYIVGVAGWATGLQLGNDSPGIQYTAHRTIGIVLFCLATLQVLALLLRPTKDHKYKLYWNIYHHSVGYTVIILSIINIFRGFNILRPEKNWKKAYIGIIVVLAAIAAFLEGYAWIIVAKRKKSACSEKLPHRLNGARTQQNRVE